MRKILLKHINLYVAGKVIYRLLSNVECIFSKNVFFTCQTVIYIFYAINIWSWIHVIYGEKYTCNIQTLM